MVSISSQRPWQYRYETGAVSAIYKFHEFETIAGIKRLDMNLVRIETKRAVVAFEAFIGFEVTAEFTPFFVEDEIPMPSLRHVARDQTMDATILVTLQGDFTKGLENVDVVKVEVAATPRRIEFGEIALPYDSEADEWMEALANEFDRNTHDEPPPDIETSGDVTQVASDAPGKAPDVRLEAHDKPKIAPDGQDYPKG